MEQTRFDKACDVVGRLRQVQYELDHIENEGFQESRAACRDLVQDAMRPLWVTYRKARIDALVGLKRQLESEFEKL